MRNGEVLMMLSAAVCLTSAVCQSAAVRQSVLPTEPLTIVLLISLLSEAERRRGVLMSY